MARSLEHVALAITEDGSPVLSCLCDCGTNTHVKVIISEQAQSAAFAYTCDGCTTSHWLTLEKIHGEVP